MRNRYEEKLSEIFLITILKRGKGQNIIVDEQFNTFDHLLPRLARTQLNLTVDVSNCGSDQFALGVLKIT